MTAADKQAVDALARHFAYQDGEWWDQCPAVKQQTYTERALDVVQVLSLIYQPPTMADSARRIFADHAKMLDSFPRPRSADR